jgi:uncharacterized protein (DUF58 family)
MPRPEPATSLPLDWLIEQRTQAARSRNSGARGITQLPGLARTRLRGRGLDFDEMRPYAEGDDVRHIDWNVTARTGRPYTRLYREERERAVTVALDLRASMFTGSQRLKAVAAGEYAAALLWRVAANQDRAGALVFDDDETVVSRPAARQRGVLEALGAIADRFESMQGQIADKAASQPLGGVLHTINRLSRNSGLIVLMSDCHGVGPDFEQELAVAGRRQKLVLLRIADPLELEGLPPGAYAYAGERGPAVADLGRTGADNLRQELARRNADLAMKFEAFGVPYLVVSTDTPSGDVWALLAQHGIV